MHPRLPGEGAVSPDEPVEQIPSGRSQPEFFVKFGGRDCFTPLELRIGLGDGLLDVLNFIWREISGKLLSKAREEECFVLARKLQSHLQNIMHTHGGSMHHQRRLCKPFAGFKLVRCGIEPGTER